jgi:two-component system, NtrC family, sensor kinase
MTIHRKTVFIFSAIFTGLFFFLFLLTRIVFLPVLLAVFLSSAAAVLLFEIIILIRLTRLNKSTEKKLKEAYEQLKETQSQLIQSAKMASIGMLAGGVAHEINNPLIGVLNNVQLVKLLIAGKKEFKVEDFKELLDVVEDSALRCAKITRTLLDFSHSPKGVYQRSSLNEIIEKVDNLLVYEMRLGNITIDKQLDSSLPQISADSLLLQQAIFDLITNARWAIQKKSGKLGGVITIKTAYEPENSQVILAISDTGIGMSEDELKKIFRPFFTTKPLGEGTGLGLSIVQDIIKEHKGEIEVESKTGAGSTFKIKFPAA